MIAQPPPGQGPIDPRGAFTPPPAPNGAVSYSTGGGSPPVMGPQMPPNSSAGMPPNLPPGMMPPMMPPPGFPPGMYPPMFVPPPPRRERSFARAIFMTLATTIFSASLALNVYLLFASGVMSGGGLRQTNIVDGDPSQKIAVLPIDGPIFGEMSQRFDRWLTSAERDANVKAIVLEIDSPGGTVTASDEIFNRLKRFKSQHPSTPIVVSMSSLAASGGYYIACGGDHLIAQPSTLTGSIGVLLPQWNLSKLMNKWGIDETTIESTGATYKNAGSMFRAEKPEERAYMQDIADKMFALFKDVVAKGRQGKLKRPMEEIANGKIFTAADAQALGLIDQIGYADDAYNEAAKRAGLTKKMVVKYHTPETFFDVLSSQSNVPPPQGASGGGVTINGVNISARDLHELITPRMMYLWRGQ